MAANLRIIVVALYTLPRGIIALKGFKERNQIFLKLREISGGAGLELLDSRLHFHLFPMALEALKVPS